MLLKTALYFPALSLSIKLPMIFIPLGFDFTKMVSHYSFIGSFLCCALVGGRILKSIVNKKIRVFFSLEFVLIR